MSNYYKPNRGSSWNFGGNNWKLSRSKIDLFTECPRCFYLDNKLGIKRPEGPPFNINKAIDKLLKQEFDVHRAKGTMHPLQKKYKIGAVPAKHANIDIWRENFKGVQYVHPLTHMTISGAIDDLWVKSPTPSNSPSGRGRKSEYIVVDYKATAKDQAVTELKEGWQDSYKRQMEVYQWLLRKNGLKVSDTGYFVYCTGKTDAKAFDGRIEFAVHVIPYTGSDKWVEKTIINIYKTLKQNKIPESAHDCAYCQYREAIKKVEK